jgi:hypothetical protein
MLFMKRKAQCSGCDKIESIVKDEVHGGSTDLCGPCFSETEKEQFKIVSLAQAHANKYKCQGCSKPLSLGYRRKCKECNDESVRHKEDRMTVEFDEDYLYHDFYFNSSA